MVLAGIIIALFGTKVALRNMHYLSKFKTLAVVYEIGENVNDEYQIAGTDNQNTLWLQKRNKNCTYVAIVSSDYQYLKIFFEKIKWLWKTSLKDSVNIKIIEQIERVECVE